MGFNGHKHTLETRNKIRKSLQGRTFSPKTHKKMSDAQRGKNNPMWGRRAENHPRWRGGRYYHEAGYILIYAPEHPHANKGYVFEHRLVVEKALGRYLNPNEQIHHINDIRDDNCLENLQPINHHRQTICPRCGWPMGNMQDYADFLKER